MRCGICTACCTALLTIPFLPAAASDTLSIKESVVSSLKVGGNTEESPAGVNVITSLDIKRGASFTVADALKSEPGLSKGGDGIWATNINIRGFSENRLVTLVDHNRIETATDLTASLSMIDVNDIERVEVIRGAQSSIYGSGAVGGIINIITKDGHFAGTPYFNACATANYSSMNNGHGEYLSINGGGRRWYVKANGSYSGASDARTPQGPLKNSGYKSCSTGAIAAFKPTGNQVLKAQFQYNRGWDVGIPGGASFSPQATASYRNISRLMASLSYNIQDLPWQMERLLLKAWYQGITRDVLMLPNAPVTGTGAVPKMVTPFAAHNTAGINAEGYWAIGSRNRLVAGAEFWRRRISSDRNKYIDQYAAGDVSSSLIRNEKPLPDASHASAGIFIQDEMRLYGDRLILSVGGRADINAVRNGECHNVESVTNVTAGKVNPNPPGKFVTFSAGSRKEPSWSANAGLLYKAGARLDLALNASKSYRSPSLEELFKFIDLSGNKVHFGNPSLKAEKGLGGDAGIRYHGSRLDLNISAYVNGIRDMIVERQANVPMSGANDTLVLDNASRALLYGFDGAISYEPLRGLKFFAAGTCPIGLELSQENGSLPMIPPLNGRAGVSYEHRRYFGAELSVTAAGAKKEGKIAPGERPTDAWCRLDFSVHSGIINLRHCNIQLFGGIDNVTDATYTNFLSTNRGNIICEPGRNFYLRMSLSFY